MLYQLSYAIGCGQARSGGSTLAKGPWSTWFGARLLIPSGFRRFRAALESSLLVRRMCWDRILACVCKAEYPARAHSNSTIRFKTYILQSSLVIRLFVVNLVVNPTGTI
jgi:hypothetical protein